VGVLQPIEELGHLGQALTAGHHQVDEFVMVGHHVLGLGDGLT